MQNKHSMWTVFNASVWFHDNYILYSDLAFSILFYSKINLQHTVVLDVYKKDTLMC